MNDQPLKFYFLPGMDYRFPIFSRIRPELKGSLVHYPKPTPKESLTCFAKRLAANMTENSVLIGASFGGILALEISKFLKPAGCIIIASVKSPREFPPAFQCCRLFGGRVCSWSLAAVGRILCNVPKRYSPSWAAALRKMTADNGSWHRWAMAAILNWTPSTEPSPPLLHIHGDQDTAFPEKYVKADIVIPGGRHSLPISHPEEVLEAVSRFVSKL